MPWNKPLGRELPLKDGRVLRTLQDARYVFASGVFSGVKHSPPLEHAIDLLLKAANSGDDDDVQAATDQVAIALRVHGIWRDANRASPPTKVLTFADYPADMVWIERNKCGRSGRLNKARLIAEHGANLPLPDLRHVLAACPRRGQMHDPCEAVFPDLVLHKLKWLGTESYPARLPSLTAVNCGRLHCAAECLIATFDGISHWPALEHARDLLMTAAGTGKRKDVAAAAIKSAIALGRRKLLR